MDKRLGKNILLQTLYQILAIITPLITTPHLLRTLGPSGTGVYSFTLTNAMYFSVFAMLGVANYGCREVAKVQNDVKKRSIVFWNIYSIQFVATIMMIAFYMVYLLFVDDYRDIAILQIITIIANLFDVNWYFFGVEKFRLTVTRNVIIKIITVILVVTLVNKNNGLMIYTLIMGLGTLISNFLLMPFLRKEVEFAKIDIHRVFQIISPILVLFIPVLASSVFHIMDKTMLGNISGMTELGYYTSSDKIINIPIGIINGLGTVYLPRISSMVDKNDDQLNVTLFESFEVFTILIMALAFGLAAISDEFVPIFFGDGYDKCVNLIKLFAPVLIVKSYSVYVRMNILIPFHEERKYTIAVIIGAFVNLLTNLLLIPRYDAYGAVIGTLVAETAVCLLQTVKMPTKLDINKVLREFLTFITIGALMYLLVRLVAMIKLRGIVAVIVEIVLGGVIYIVLSLLFLKKEKSQIITVFMKKRGEK